MRPLLSLANAIDRILRSVASAAVWLLPILAVVIAIDVVTRKLGWFLPILTSSRLQELEWHIHASLFALWLGFAYSINGHPRVDPLYSRLSLRAKARVEFIGCVVFALPYALVLLWYLVPFVASSYLEGEGSNIPGGLPQRWIVKSIFAAGFVLLALSIVSSILRLVAYLFARAPAEEAQLPFAENDGTTI